MQSCWRGVVLTLVCGRQALSSRAMLLPPSLGDWLPEGHLARFVNDLVDEIDLTPDHPVA